MTTTLAAAQGPTPHEITVFLLSLALLLGLARLLGEVARMYRQPAVLGEILAGVLLGQTVFGFISPEWYTWLFPSEGDTFTMLEGFIILAASLLLLVVGMEVDLSTVWRQGKAALLVSVCGIALPMTAGMTLASLMPEFFAVGPRGAEALWPFAIFVGIAMSITALPVIAKILMDLNLAKSDMGMLIISSAMLNDLVGWIGFAVVLALLPASALAGAEAAETASMSVPMTIGLTLLFLVVMLTLGRSLIHRSLPYVQAHLSWPGGVLVYVLIIALACAAFTEKLGIHSIFGAFVAGVAIGDSHHLKARTRDTIEQFIINIFAPVFFASIGLRLNFVSEFSPALVGLVFGVAATGKILGSFFGAKTAGLGMRESWATGFGMASQGAVGIILGQLALDAGLIGEELMVAIVIMALTTSLMAGPLMQAVLRSKQQRRLKEFLGENAILTDTHGRTAESAIRELSSRAGEMLNMRSGHIYEAVMQRERIMHTGLPGGLAVPHARLDKLKSPRVVVGRYRPGVDFDAADGRPATLVCLLLTPSNQPESQIELLGLVARTFGKPQIRRELMEAKTPTEFLAALNRAESGNGETGEGNEATSTA
ncbi:MAG: cation:proton antiporter [Phycisphaeraceae bacterium]